MVGINGMISTTVVPFGGVKEKVVWTWRIEIWDGRLPRD
jgi:hypothetical protein